MPIIHVALQEGFQGDSVKVSLDGAEVFRKDGVKTRMQIGKAASFDLPDITGPHNLRIDVISSNTHKSFPITVSANDLYVGISITQDGDITHNISEEPFRYA
jgi:hypothetical protein